MSLLQLIIILILVILLHQQNTLSNAATICDEDQECQENNISGIDELRCTGSLSCYKVETTSISKISCEGQDSCKGAKMQHSTENTEITCSGEYSCFESELSTSGTLSCMNTASCSQSVLEGDTFRCSSDNACSSSTISVKGSLVCDSINSCYNTAITPSSGLTTVECTASNSCRQTTISGVSSPHCLAIESCALSTISGNPRCVGTKACKQSGITGEALCSGQLSCENSVLNGDAVCSGLYSCQDCSISGSADCTAQYSCQRAIINGAASCDLDYSCQRARFGVGYVVCAEDFSCVDAYWASDTSKEQSSCCGDGCHRVTSAPLCVCNEPVAGQYVESVCIPDQWVQTVIKTCSSEADLENNGKIIVSSCSQGASLTVGQDVVATECQHRYYCKDGVQTICPRGSFCPLGASEPTLCSIGSYCEEGSMDELDCPELYFCETPSTKTLCSSGSFCPSGSYEEKPCDAGFYCETPSTRIECPNASSGTAYYCAQGSTLYKECKAGYYCPDPTKQFECVNVGKKCPAGSAFEVDCNAFEVCLLNGGTCPGGVYCDDQGSQFPCPPSYYCPAGQREAKECLAGYKCPGNTTALSDENACSLGSYCGGKTVEESPCPSKHFCPSSAVKYMCQLGSFCPEGSSQEKSCEAGYVCERTDVMVKCANNGSYCPKSSFKIQDCPQGFVCHDSALPYERCNSTYYCPKNSVEAQLCEPSFYCPFPEIQLPCSEDSKLAVYCPSGSLYESICEAGYFCSNSTSMIPCDSGFVCERGSRHPIPCPPGFYCEDKSKVAIPCQYGSFCGEGSATTQQLCPSGSFCPNPSLIHSCSTGSYCEEGSMDELDCPELYFCETPSTKTLCSSGSFCPSGSYEEKPCDAGFYCNPPLGVVKSPCPLSTYCGANSTAPGSCEAGFYCSSSASKEVCPESYYCSINSTQLQLCEAGSFCPTPSEKYPCSIGSYCPEGSRAEAPCDQSFYCESPASRSICPVTTYCGVNSTQAKRCPASHYCPTSMLKLDCPRGHFCEEGSVEPSQCPGNTISQMKQEKCTACGDGMVANVAHTACRSCGGDTLGYLCNTIDGTERLCNRGYYCPDSITELECRSGKYCPRGSFEELACPIGFYCHDPTSKIQCVGGTFCYENSTKPHSCPPNHFCPDGKEKYVCSKGTYCGNNTVIAEPCNQGFFCRHPYLIEACPRGSYCPPGAVEPIQCQIGSYRDKEKGIEIQSCVECPVLTTTNTTGSETIEDCLCNVGYYSSLNDDGVLSCTRCDSSNMICGSLGLSIAGIQPMDGYWRSSGESLDIIPCPYGASACSVKKDRDGNTDKLVVGNSNICTLGHEGFLCARCSVDYYRNSLNVDAPCVKCPDAQYQVTVMVIICIVIWVFCIYLIGRNLTRQRKYRKKMNSPGRGTQTLPNGRTIPRRRANTLAIINRKTHNVVQRLALNHIQILGVVGQFDLLWPQTVSSALSTADSVVGLSFLSGGLIGSTTDCNFFLSAENIDKPILNIFLGLLLLSVFAVMILLTIVVIMPVTYKCLGWDSHNPSEQRVQSTTKEKFIVCIIALIYVMYSSLARSGFGIFACTEFPGDKDDISRLNGALDTICYEGDHLFWVMCIGLPFFIVIILGLPFIGWYKVFTYRSVLYDSQHVISTYSYLYKGYQQQYWYWESVVLARKLAIAVISVFAISYSPYVQGLSATFVLNVAFGFQLYYQPYESSKINNIETLGIGCSLLTVYIGLWSFNSSENIRMYASLAIFFINIAWFSMVILIIGKGKGGEIGKKVKKIAASSNRSRNNSQFTKRSGYVRDSVTTGENIRKQLASYNYQAEGDASTDDVVKYIPNPMVGRVKNNYQNHSGGMHSSNSVYYGGSSASSLSTSDVQNNNNNNNNNSYRNSTLSSGSGSDKTTNIITWYRRSTKSNFLKKHLQKHKDRPYQ